MNLGGRGGEYGSQQKPTVADRDPGETKPQSGGGVVEYYQGSQDGQAPPQLHWEHNENGEVQEEDEQGQETWQIPVYSDTQLPVLNPWVAQWLQPQHDETLPQAQGQQQGQGHAIQPQQGEGEQISQPVFSDSRLPVMNPWFAQWLQPPVGETFSQVQDQEQGGEGYTIDQPQYEHVAPVLDEQGEGVEQPGSVLGNGRGRGNGRNREGNNRRGRNRGRNRENAGRNRRQRQNNRGTQTDPEE